MEYKIEELKDIVLIHIDSKYTVAYPVKVAIIYRKY